jgi:hypothetical protein
MSINGMKQLQGEKRADFLARCKTAQAEANAAREALLPPKRSRKKAAPARHEDSRVANRIDGYDRDDLGESPDF